MNTDEPKQLGWTDDGQLTEVVRPKGKHQVEVIKKDPPIFPPLRASPVVPQPIAHFHFTGGGSKKPSGPIREGPAFWR